MSATGFVTSFTGSPVAPNSSHASKKVCHRRSNHAGLFMRQKSEKKGLFGKIKDSIIRPLITVPGGSNDGSLIECVFCKGTGFCDCDACKGTGKDSLGACFNCDGRTYLKCTVCCGVGTVDRIRRGGTDDKRKFVIQKKSKS